jgi:hypothetical protein
MSCRLYLIRRLIFFSDQSQATEMLQEMLANDNDATCQPTETHDSAFKPHSNGFSSDSSPSRNSNSLPQYHFYGLASTQTQSQLHDEDVAIHEGSQKENVGAAERNKDLGQPVFRPPSPHAASPKKGPSRTLHVDSRNGSLSTNKVRLSCGHQTYGFIKIFRKLLRKISLLFLFNPLTVVRSIPLNLQVGTRRSLVLYPLLLHMIRSRVIRLKILRNSLSPSRNSLPYHYLNWDVVLSQKAPIPVAPPTVQRLATHQSTSSARLVQKAEY